MTNPPQAKARRKGSLLYGFLVDGEGQEMIRVYDGVGSNCLMLEYCRSTDRPIHIELGHPLHFNRSINICCTARPIFVGWKGRAYWNGKRLKGDKYNPLPTTL